ncbi:hypothetical protein [Saccharothrix coeruleofusca]|uniref:Uncharacterized protein n=1 Tax=Saccharothrix coeruleofusca TaxID=33919 RepID=A0A918AR11_9PSEU|nr:hypothetical protein [Saccharothrix coeruleofusca]GGP73338.1 hypothetical protein GCM10010185_53560 [Saccharothrix coeruleofusca]
MTRLLHLHRPLVLFSLLMAAMIPVSLVGLAVDDRVLAGSPIWLKPLKFFISLVLYGLTLAWVLKFTTRWRKLTWWAGTVLAVGGTVEMVAIVGQVVRGRQSHFNVATSFDAAVFAVMAVTITVVWAMHAIISASLLLTRFTDRVAGWAVRLGMAISLVGLALGALMTRPKPGQNPADGIVGAHSVGVPDGGPQMAVTGWSTTGGDLRIPHFVGIHALQVLPLVVMLLGSRATVRAVWAAATGYGGLTALVTWQALRGQPLLQPDALTLAGLAAVLLATAVVAWAPPRRTAGTARTEKAVQPA